MARKYFFILMLILLSSCEKNKNVNENLLKFYGDALEDIGYSVARADNGYVIAGQLTEVHRPTQNYILPSSSSRKMGIIRTNDDGNALWQKSFGDKLPSVGTKAIVLGDGSVICVGYVIDTVPPFQRNIFIVKSDGEGNPLLQKIYKRPRVDDKSNQYATDIVQTSEGFMVLGVTDAERTPISDSAGNVAGKKDILFLRISNTLEVISTYATGFPGDDEAVAIKPDINGGFIVLATTTRSNKPAAEQGGTNILLMRVNDQGTDTEQRIIGGKENEYAADFEVMNDGYMITATIGSEGTSQTGYVWKMPVNIHASSVFEDDLEILSGSVKLSYSISAISRYKTSSFVIAGKTGTGSTSSMLIFIIDGEGSLVLGKSLITGGSGIQAAYDVISDENDNIIAVGKNSYESNSMISLLKFRF